MQKQSQNNEINIIHKNESSTYTNKHQLSKARAMKIVAIKHINIESIEAKPLGYLSTIISSTHQTKTLVIRHCWWRGQLTV